MNHFDENTEWDDESVITMIDDEGNESEYHVLASREDNGRVYLLVEEAVEIDEDSDDDEIIAEVLHFKCIATEEDEMIFEIVDDTHEDFDRMLTLFKDEYEALGVTLEDGEEQEGGLN